jgi:carboxyl-terminal processing protease
MRKIAAALGSGIVSAALLWVAMATAQNPNGKDLPTVVKGQPASAMRGIWQSRGYGYVVSVDRSAAKIFHIAGSLCFADPAKPDLDNLLGFYRPWGQGSIAFSNEQGETRYIFDQLKELPQACTDTTPWSQPRIAAFVAATFADYYPSFQQRGIDWKERMAAAEPSFRKITDDAGLFEAIKTLLAGIEDQHVRLNANVNGEKLRFSPGEGTTLSAARAIVGDKMMDKYEWLPSYKRNVLDTILEGEGHEVANQKLYWGRVGDIGYVNLLSMEELSPSEDGDKIAVDAALDAAIAAFAGTRAVIVDVTYNRGGYDSVSRRAAGRFAESEQLAYTKVAFGARDVPPQPFYATPSKRSRYLGPVYLLTSDVTVSAGEIFTLLMRALPNVVHVGGKTRGALSDTTEMKLPNNWSLVLPMEVYLDREGQNYEVRGIPPREKIDVFPPQNLAGAHARAVLALMDMIRRNVPPVDNPSAPRP